MKREAFFVIFLVSVFLMGWSFTAGMTSEYLAGVKHMVNSTIRIEGEKTVYFDPYDVREEVHDADLVLISHPHWDHFLM